MNAGYSQRPLVQKLGIKEGWTIAVINAPENYLALLPALPEGVTMRSDLQNDLPFIHYFCTERRQLEAIFPELRAALLQNGMVWISWPKKSAKIASDLNENIIRELGLACGLVDVKVAAVGFVWSGLKFVIRIKDRK